MPNPNPNPGPSPSPSPSPSPNPSPSPSPSPNQAASNYPLRGGKATCWEGGTRGVGFVSGGARSGLSAGVRGGESSAMIHVTDWLPTLCEAAGCALAPHVAEGGTHTHTHTHAQGGTNARTLRGASMTKQLDGVSAWGAISRGEVGSRTEILISLAEVSGSPALRVGDYKLLGRPPQVTNERTHSLWLGGGRGASRNCVARHAILGA